MLPSQKAMNYCVYMLRFWQERGQGLDEEITWRWSLEDPHTGERIGFADCDTLFAFLTARIEQGVPSDGADVSLE